ncbi:hypothetical protein AB6W79_10805 [Pasteurella multocida]|uniref:hypothetical protein n=1 Tax=Pasteurella multocida TaxID=747 RepID=UPI0029A10B33|nr:hypothetical protein [Pasteurella multocida]MDX3903952.1 hypothetical protein [Pasteurella multocida]MDX3983528.1 hypothetical protein [Pasteurella multocida]
MKFIDFGKQLAKPIKFIKQRTVFLPKPLQQAVVFAVIFAGLPLFILGFFILRIWAYKHISLYSEYKNMSDKTQCLYPYHMDYEVDSELDGFDFIADGFHSAGPQGEGYYENGFRMPEYTDDDWK